MTKIIEHFFICLLAAYSNPLSREFLHGPVAKTTPSNAEDLSSVPGWGIKIP